MTGVEWRMVLDTVFLPTAVTAGGLTAATVAARRWPRSRAPLVTLALAVGFASAEIAIRGWQDYWPADITRRLPQGALLVVIASGVRALFPARWLGLLISIAIAVVVSSTFALSGATTEFTSGEKVAWWCSLVALFLVSQVSLEQLAACRPAISLARLWAGCVGIGAGLLAASGSLSLGQVCGALAVGLTIVILFAWRSSLSSLHAGPAELVAVVFGVLLLAGHLFSGLPRSAALLMALSPHVAWMSSLPWLKNRPWRSEIAQGLVVIALLGAAVGIVIANRPTQSEPSNPYESYMKESMDVEK